LPRDECIEFAGSTERVRTGQSCHNHLIPPPVAAELASQELGQPGTSPSARYSSKVAFHPSSQPSVARSSTSPLSPTGLFGESLLEPDVDRRRRELEGRVEELRRENALAREERDEAREPRDPEATRQRR